MNAKTAKNSKKERTKKERRKKRQQAVEAGSKDTAVSAADLRSAVGSRVTTETSTRCF
jgi:hypothetical protein